MPLIGNQGELFETGYYCSSGDETLFSVSASDIVNVGA